MCEKRHLSARNISETFLTDPIPVTGKIFTLPEQLQKKHSSESHQPWDGFDPPCTLEDTASGPFFPSQTFNIKVGTIYRGIEHDGDEWMRMACDIARESVEQGGGPFGAVILQIDKETNEIIRYWKNHNQVTEAHDPTAHAEVMTIRSVCQSLGVFNLGSIVKDESKLSQPGDESYCVIYSSAEPCPMCYSAICWAKITTLFFAATRFDAAVQGVCFSDEEIYDELAVPYSDRAMTVGQCTTGNSLDAFNLWKRSKKTTY